jgi:hypothetical protein
MVNWNTQSVKVRCGDFKCRSCGTHFDPTNGRKCPNCNQRLYVNFFAAIIISFLVTMCVIDAGAQTDPGPAPECYWIDEQWVCISHIALTPFVPTSTPVPAPTVAPTVTPTPTIVIQPFPVKKVWLPLIYR